MYGALCRPLRSRIHWLTPYLGMSMATRRSPFILARPIQRRPIGRVDGLGGVQDRLRILPTLDAPKPGSIMMASQPYCFPAQKWTILTFWTPTGRSSRARSKGPPAVQHACVCRSGFRRARLHSSIARPFLASVALHRLRRPRVLSRLGGGRCACSPATSPELAVLLGTARQRGRKSQGRRSLLCGHRRLSDRACQGYSRLLQPQSALSSWPQRCSRCLSSNPGLVGNVDRVSSTTDIQIERAAAGQVCLRYRPSGWSPR